MKASLASERVGAYTLLPSVSNERISRLLAVLFVSAGLAGVLIERAQTGGAGASVPAKGGFWKILAPDGRVKQVRTPSNGIVILPGDSFRFHEVYGSTSKLKVLRLRVQNTGEQSGYMRIHFRNQGTEMYRLAVVPGESFLGTLSYRSEGKPPERLATDRRSDLAGDPADPFDLTLRLDGPTFVVEINGEELLRATDDRIPRGHVEVWGDHVRLLQAGISGTTLRADGTSKGFFERDDLRSFRTASVPEAGWTMPSLLWALAVLMAAACYLRSLCMGAPPVRVLWRATLAALAPAGALLALRPWLTVPHESLLLLAASSFGLMFALYVLREHTRAIVASGIRGGARILVVVAMLGCLAAWVNAQVRAVALRPAIVMAEKAVAKVSSEPFGLPGSLQLGASNALTVPGPFRSVDLDASVTLAPDSLFELRLRAQSGLPNGVALFLSTDARWKSGFYIESKAAFAPMGDDFGVLEADHPYTLAVRVHGDDFVVSLDGRQVVSARMRAFASGSVVALAARGEVVLSDLSIRPIVPEPPVRDASDEAWAAGTVPWMLLGLLAVAAAVLLIIPFPRALEAAAWMLVPIMIGTHGWTEPNGRLMLVPFAAILLAFTGFVLPWTLMHSHRSGPLRTAAFLLLAVLFAGAALTKSTGPPVLAVRKLGVVWSQFDLPRIEPGLSHLQHPYIRRFNSYLVDHTFRGRRFTAEPAPGVARVISLGTSSTWGHGIDVSTGMDYPTVLEALLSERMPEQRVEVINAAVRGSSVARLLRIFRESLLTFQPDIVTLSVYFNDAFYLTQVDEDAYLTRIGQTDYAHGLLERGREMIRSDRHQRIANTIWKSMEEGKRDSIGAWREVMDDTEVTSPPERFESSIRAFAELGREHGFQLVLIKEPIRNDQRRLWRDEFRAVMDRLGEEFNLPVVDPTEALAAGGGRKLFMDEVHPLPRGHRIMAEVLAPVIETLIRSRSEAR